VEEFLFVIVIIPFNICHFVREKGRLDNSSVSTEAGDYLHKQDLLASHPTPLRVGDNSTNKLQCTLFLKLGSHYKTGKHLILVKAGGVPLRECPAFRISPEEHAAGLHRLY
jgi:hypothetical protein